MQKMVLKSLIPVIIGLSVLTACAEESTMSSSSNGAEGEQQTEEQVEEQEAAEAVVEIQSDAFGAWKDSIDNVYASYSAVITNTGDKPAMIGDIQVNFEGSDGTILGTMPMVLAVPDIVMPGETAYIGENTVLESVSDPEAVTGASANVDFSPTNEQPMMLETEGVKLTEGKDEYSNVYTVTGTVINPNEEMADDIRLAAGLYDAQGNFLGTLNGSIMVSLNQDGKAGFELNYPELPKEVRGKASEVKVKAYKRTF
ncbi:FxLYD domain-containing protein [Halobacillus litoralis]|uniref:FxLYD domain-containing protein n=1 Tax=Halobacillus litoralis TaxID=45668 RepID=UPI001CD32603|nr:FxLYD domain-containing protein [Halobacillus litoralis]MCA0970834.1 FxLYD domain-containing protein [Halobacillus litoralis]